MDRSLTTIVLGKGEHVVKEYKNDLGEFQNYLKIRSSMNIVGKPNVSKEEIVVVSGIDIGSGIQGNVHVQHLTVRRAKRSGVGQASCLPCVPGFYEDAESSTACKECQSDTYQDETTQFHPGGRMQLQSASQQNKARRKTESSCGGRPNHPWGRPNHPGGTDQLYKQNWREKLSIDKIYKQN